MPSRPIRRGEVDGAPWIAFVPFDDRPVTYQLPIMLGEIAGQEIRTPPRAAIGNYLQPGDPDTILTWLRDEGTRGASALVASSDMIAYGGPRRCAHSRRAGFRCVLRA